MFKLFDQRFFRVYIVPGAVFQSVMVGGGYGTGREIVEYFTSYGAVGGVLGLCVAYLVLATVLAATSAVVVCVVLVAARRPRGRPGGLGSR